MNFLKCGPGLWPGPRASRRTATGKIVPVAILRDAVLRTAPLDVVREFTFHPVRSDRFHGIDRLVAPALRFADEEVAERLHAGDRLELLRVNEIGVERD